MAHSLAGGHPVICTHSYITLRCEACGKVFGDEYEYGATEKERDRLLMDARAKGWSRPAALLVGPADRCPDCIPSRKAAS